MEHQALGRHPWRPAGSPQRAICCARPAIQPCRQPGRPGRAGAGTRRYVSAFQDAPRTAGAGQTPDQVWRAANDALVAAPQPVQKAAPQPAPAHGNHHH